jgi:WD40 repeat protein
VRWEFLEKKKIVSKIQAIYRGTKTRKYVAQYKLHVAARKIQTLWRGWQVKQIWRKFLTGASLAQRLFRTRTARLQLRRLKQEAKEVGSLLVKFNHSQGEVLELRRKISEIEAGRIFAQQETQTLAKKLQVTCEEFEYERRVLEDKHRRQVQEMEEELAKTKTRAEEAENKYQLLLKSANASTVLQPTSRVVGVVKRADVQLVGAHGTGKTRLLVDLIEQMDPSQLCHFQEQKNNLIAHYSINMAIAGAEKNRIFRVIDCNGNARAGRLVKDWFPKTYWVFCVYDLCSSESLTLAQEAALEARAAGASVLLLGNKFNLDHLNHTAVNFDLTAIKEFAATHGCLALETRSLADALELVMDSFPDSPLLQPAGVAGAAAADGSDGLAAGRAEGAPEVVASGGGRTPAVSSALDSFKSWLGVGRSSSSVGGSGSVGILTPSLRGSAGLRNSLKSSELGTAGTSALRATSELQDSESAITCLTFGQEKLHAKWILLAAASKDGTVVVYKIFRTEVEQVMAVRDALVTKDDSDVSAAAPGLGGGGGGSIEVHSRLIGHTRAITSLFFNLLEDVLVTTSIDKSVRFWSVDTGEMLKVFTDSSPVPVACFLPFNPSVFIAANSNAVLRLVNVQNGQVLQKLKVETEVRALKFDDTGLFLLAGTKNGTIHVLEANDNSSLKFKFKIQLARGGITCITFVSSSSSLLVNSSDSSVTIVDCSYAAGGVLTNLTVRHRVKVAHSLLPLKCCFSPSDGGYLISGSEDKSVYLYSLAKHANYRLQLLHHHHVPVVSVATNHQDTLLVSADSLGKIVLWRRVDFSHLLASNSQ